MGELTLPASGRAVSLSEERLPMGACCAAFWHLCMSSVVMTLVEVYVVNLGQHYWGWSIARSALFLAALMMCSGVVNMAMGWLCKRGMRSDRAGLLGGSVMGCLACALLFNFDLPGVAAQVPILGPGLLVVPTIVGLLRAFALALSSKLVPPALKTWANNWAIVFMALGRGAGAVIGAVLDPNSFAPAVLGLFVVSALVCAASHRRMKPSEKAD